MEKNQEIRDLFKKYIDNQCSPAELNALLHCFSTDGHRPLLSRLIQEQLTTAPDMETQAELLESLRTRLDKRLLHPVPDTPVVTRKRWPWYAAAAAILLGAVFGLYTMTGQGGRQSGQAIAAADVLPGGNKAVLTLANGRTIDLDDSQSSITISKETITYGNGNTVPGIALGAEEASPGNLPENLQVTTPNGGTYRVILSDGTRVWLNAASTLSYPSRFTGPARVISITGQAYVEVAQDPQHPFRVNAGRQVVHALGTSFQVTNYPDEQVSTTLVSGAVNVAGYAGYPAHQPPAQVIRLAPGEQAVLAANGLLAKNSANLHSELAWRDGQFIFDNAPLENILRNISRWYDVEVRYEYPAAKGMVFFGKISRNTPLSSVLKIMEMTNKVRFRLDAPAGNQPKTLVVMQ